jgi:hypothetical protein
LLLDHPMRSTHFALLALSTSLLCLALAGCNSHRPYPVAGTVKFKDGSDVAKLLGYTITCERTEAGPDGLKASATGEVGADGKFLLSTNATNDGAYPGKYRVALTPPIPFGDAPKAADVIAAKYKDLNTTDLEITVEAKPTAVTLELEPFAKS